MSTGFLDGIKSWMSFEGWTDGGAPGSTKLDADRKVVARHGDKTWTEDVERCCDRVAAAQAKAELERRHRVPSGYNTDN